MRCPVCNAILSDLEAVAKYDNGVYKEWCNKCLDNPHAGDDADEDALDIELSNYPNWNDDEGE